MDAFDLMKTRQELAKRLAKDGCHIFSFRFTSFLLEFEEFS